MSESGRSVTPLAPFCARLDNLRDRRDRYQKGVVMPLTTSKLESKLWGAADILRGQIDSSDHKNYIFSTLFLKRLSDRFDEEVERAIEAGMPREVAESD